jgi:uncharacterized protein
VTRRWWLVAVVAAAATLLLVGRVWADIYGDYLWHAAIGTESVWRAQVVGGAALTLGSGLTAALFAFLNFFAVRKSVISLVLPRRVANVEFGEEIPGRILTGAAVVLSLLLGALLALPASGWWSLLLAMDGVRFGELDPYFQNDLGFYVARLPLESALYTWALITAGVVAFFVVVLYALTPSLRWQKRGMYASAYVRRHVTVLGGMFLLLLAWNYRIDTYRMLSAGTGPDGAFGYVDHTIGIPGNLALAVASVIAGLLVIWAGWSAQTRLALLGIGSVLVLAIVVKLVAPMIAERFANTDERAERERPYLDTRASYTRRAFAADRIVAAVPGYSFGSLVEAAPGLSAWDPLAAASALRFSDPEIAAARAGWRADDGVLELILAEPSGSHEPLEGSRWKMARVIAAAAEEGSPVLRGATAGSIGNTAPVVVEGSAAEHLVVSRSGREIAGVPLSGRARRLALAWSLRDVDLLLERFPGADPVVVARRGVRDRITAVAPPFTQLGDASIALIADTLNWVVPLYSTAQTYPLSRQFEVGDTPVNWLRQTVTAVINATTGRILLVADSAPDPLAVAWRSRFPGLFVSWSEVSSELRNGVAPPRLGARAMSIAYARFGARDSRLPRGGHVPSWNGADSLLAAERVVVALPMSGRTAGIYPVLSDQDSSAGVMVVTGGGDGVTVWVPAGGSPPWPEVARDLALAAPDSGASQALVRRGPIRTVPVADGLVFAQPRYHWPVGGTPSLSQVALLTPSGHSSAATILDAVGLSISRPPPTMELYGETAARLYDRMREALARGDWAAFGAAFDTLGGVLRRLGR